MQILVTIKILLKVLLLTQVVNSATSRHTASECPRRYNHPLSLTF
ncbi:hypothetical protein NC651_036959 [Populus alba x Populus x berolinensis]|nr:hypothetical protein NC651_036959 [Populus alba x Populus x berolinensis]